MKSVRSKIVASLCTATFVWWSFVAMPLPDSSTTQTSDVAQYPDGTNNGLHPYDSNGQQLRTKAACNQVRDQWILQYRHAYPTIMKDEAMATPCEQQPGSHVPYTGAPEGSNVNAVVPTN